MSKVRMLKTLLNQRLSAAVDEVFVVFERTIAEYEEELSRTKEENKRQRRILNAVLKKPQVVQHQIDISEETFQPDQQEPESVQIKEEEEPQPSHIKEEEQENEISKFPSTGVTVKSEDRDEDYCGGAQPDGFLAPLSDADDITSYSSDSDVVHDNGDEHSKSDMTCHTDNKPVKCWHCDKTVVCNCKSSLYRHTRTHTGEKPFACSICGKRFFHNSKLTRHAKIHTGEKIFACSFCYKGFSLHKDLKIHIRTHTGEKPFACSVCGAKFRRKGHLEAHKKAHTGVKPFACSVCGKRFVHNSKLTRHEKIHSGEKPFSCGVCKKRFTRKDYLKRHKCAFEKSSGL